jgi:hypothetical protein
MNRLEREEKTIEKMILLYCKNHHQGNKELCQDCNQLKDYAIQRIQRCPFGIQKTTCQKCTVHCYNQSNQQAIRAVMRYAGPRMLLRHPYLSLRHLLYP